MTETQHSAMMNTRGETYTGAAIAVIAVVGLLQIGVNTRSLHVDKCRLEPCCICQFDGRLCASDRYILHRPSIEKKLDVFLSIQFGCIEHELEGFLGELCHARAVVVGINLTDAADVVRAKVSTKFTSRTPTQARP